MRILAQQHGLWSQSWRQLACRSILTSLAELESEEGRLETAWATAHRAREVAERLSEHQSVAEAHRILGKVAARQGRHAVADEAFAVGLAAAERSGMAARVVDVNESYAEVLEARGDRSLQRPSLVPRQARARLAA